MSPIDFGITGSKVKITGALNVNMVSAYYLENFISQSHHISHIYNGVTSSKVNVFIFHILIG
jgi:hypothetical protein